MSEQKFCVACANFGYGKDRTSCSRVIGVKEDLVYGRSWVMDERPCHEIRADESSCGQEGRHFEAKYSESERAAMRAIYEKMRSTEPNTCTPKEEPSMPRKWWHIFT